MSKSAGRSAPPAQVITALKIEGMTCGSCTSAVESAFKNVPGAADVSVSLVLGRAIVKHDPSVLSTDTIIEKIEDRGFDATVISTEPSERDSTNATADIVTTLAIGGMTCGSCTSAVQSGVQGITGVKSVDISLLSERAVVKHDSTVKPERLVEAIEDRGFDASIVESNTMSAQRRATPDQVSTTVAIQGMTCGACTSSIEEAFSRQPGVVKFDISLLAERAIVVHDPASLPTAEVIELIEDRGFDAQIVSSTTDTSVYARGSKQVTINIHGLPNGVAADNLEKKLKDILGVESAEVKIATSRAFISYLPSRIGIRQLVEAIEKEGYSGVLATAEDTNAQLESLAKKKDILEWKRSFFISLVFAIPVMIFNMILPMYLPVLDPNRCEIFPGLYMGDVICLVLTVPVQFSIGKKFYKSGFKSLRHKSPTMDVLVMLGTSAAFFFSVLGMLVSVLIEPHSKPSTLFDTSTMLITFITLGRWLENRAKGQTSLALSRLMSLTPSMATIYEDSVAAEKAAEVPKNDKPAVAPAIALKLIPTDLIEVGDIVCLRPGDKVPADGVVIRGESYIDEAMVTGEAIPIRKAKAQNVLAGTVNGAGRLDFRVTRAGQDTELSQIVKLVQNAQMSRASIQRVADVVAGYFVPVIITLGLVTFFGWLFLSQVLPSPPKIFADVGSGGIFMVCLKMGISVIVCACPCALGLSTPTAVMVGTGVGAEQGTIFKGGAALEAATKIQHVVFDKTGTLTEGKMSVSEANIEPAWTTDEERRLLWWLIVGLAEMSSEHPIGRAVASASRRENRLSDEDGLDGSTADFAASPGKGVSAVVEPAASGKRTSYRILIGNLGFLHEHKISTPASPYTASPSSAPDRNLHLISHLADATLVHVAIDGAYTGTLVLKDTIKATAPLAIAALHKMGISTSMVTGDAHNPALAVAAAVGIPEDFVHSNVVPEEKQATISRLQSSSRLCTAMVGDGINDSPALATADVGIALSSGTDVAVEAADIVLTRGDDLLSIPTSLCLAHSIFNRIRLNLLWACVYNAIGLPFAMGVFLPITGTMLHPMAAGAAMAASSVSVVVSSLLLKFWKKPRWLKREYLEKEVGKMPGIHQTWQRSRFWGDKKPGLWNQFRRTIRGWIRKIKGVEEGDQGYVPLQTVEP